MTDFIPLFPLKLVVYPGEHLNLHIFEPRYKQLVRECEQNSLTFGIPSFIENKVTDFGTEIKLLNIEKRYENGELDIKTQGIGIFRIDEYYSKAPNKLYAGADIKRVKHNVDGDFLSYDRILQSVSELFKVLDIEKELPANSKSFKTYDIAHHVGFSLEEEYQLLCIPSEMERQQFILSHLDKMIPVVKEMEKLRKKARMNGHFKNIIPPKLL